jgi:hypothetical protein
MREALGYLGVAAFAGVGMLSLATEPAASFSWSGLLWGVLLLGFAYFVFGPCIGAGEGQVSQREGEEAPHEDVA